METGEKHYYLIRERFNESYNPLDFLFLNRAGFNGMIRFNKKGGFNTATHAEIFDSIKIMFSQ